MKCVMVYRGRKIINLVDVNRNRCARTKLLHKHLTYFEFPCAVVDEKERKEGEMEWKGRERKKETEGRKDKRKRKKREKKRSNR